MSIDLVSDLLRNIGMSASDFGISDSDSCPCQDCGHFHSDSVCPDSSGPCGDYRCCIN